MTDMDTIIVTSAENLREAARGIVARLERNEGNITTNGVLAEFATALAGGRQNWGGIIQHSVFISGGIQLASVVDRIRPAIETDNSIVCESDFECLAPEADTSISRMLELAALWRKGEYEQRYDTQAACRFRGKDIFEFELVCVADLLNAIECRKTPIFRDSAYHLLHEWGHSSTGIGRTYSAGFLKYHIHRMIFNLSYSVPLSPSSQMSLILQTWSYLKFSISGGDGGETWVQLVRELGWIEDEDVDAI